MRCLRLEAAVRFSAACLLIVPASIAATLHVPGDYSTIQAAIDVALDGDTVLVGPGSYDAIDFIGKGIVVISEQGPGSTSIGPGGEYGNVAFVNGETAEAILEGFEISGGGRGIYLEYSSPVIRGNLIRDNNGAWYGGGIYSYYSSPIIENNLILDNDVIGSSYTAQGGGLFVVMGSVMLVNNVIADNSAFDGGGIYFKYGGNHLLVNNTLANNYGNSGIQAETASLSIRNCILWGSSWVEIIGGSQLDISWTDIEGGQEGIYGTGSVAWGDGMISDTPMFAAGTLSEYQLDEALSPCVDAGDPSPEYNDPEDPANPGYALYPALGLLRNDMGAYGGGGSGYWVGIAEEPSPPMNQPSLMAFPNPCASVSALLFELPETGPARLVVFDASGHMIISLTDGEFAAGIHTAVFDGSGLPSGVYLCRLQAGASSATTRVVLIR